MLALLRTNSMENITLQRTLVGPGERRDILFIFTPQWLDFVHRLTKIGSASDSSPARKRRAFR